MIYALDCEFSNFNGDLISLALVAADGREFYWTTDRLHKAYSTWVEENVIHNLATKCTEGVRIRGGRKELANGLTGMLIADPEAMIIADWPEDFIHFNRALLTGAGQMVPLGSLMMAMSRCNPYEDLKKVIDAGNDGGAEIETMLNQAIRHNALWDARVLMQHLRVTGAVPPQEG